VLGALFRLLLIAFLIYVAFLILRLIRAVRRAARGPRPAAGREKALVKDEVCGTYLPRDEALHDVRHGRDVYFCSEECRRKSRTED
jgi:YHS domain-containing protein